MIQTSDFNLGIGAAAPVYKASAFSNGVIMRLGVNGVYTTAVTNLLSPDGTAYADGITYGNGLFYNAAEKNCVGYAGAPTVASAVPVFAGIVVRSPAVQSSYPANGEKAYEYNKFLIVKDGYVLYRSGFDTAGNAIKFSSALVKAGNYMYVKTADGSVAFGTAATVTKFTTVGRIAELHPDDESWVVKVDAVNAVITA